MSPGVAPDHKDYGLGLEPKAIYSNYRRNIMALSGTEALQESRKRVTKHESRRRAFIKKMQENNRYLELLMSAKWGGVSLLGSVYYGVGLLGQEVVY